MLSPRPTVKEVERGRSAPTSPKQQGLLPPGSEPFSAEYVRQGDVL